MYFQYLSLWCSALCFMLTSEVRPVTRQYRTEPQGVSMISDKCWWIEECVGMTLRMNRMTYFTIHQQREQISFLSFIIHS